MQSHILNERQAAQYLSISVRTLQARRFKCQQPPFLKIGRSVRYRLDDLDVFVAEHVVAPSRAA